MGQIISASIDLTKIDKSKVKDHKNGSKYYQISIFLNDEKDKYGNNVSIATGQTEEERKSKVKKVYLGNGKTVWRGQERMPDSSTGVGDVD